jgi:ABC-type sulfate transport system substrate-binding protein
MKDIYYKMDTAGITLVLAGRDIECRHSVPQETVDHLTSQLKELVKGKNYVVYSTWVDLVKTGIQIVETDPNLRGLQKKEAVRKAIDNVLGDLINEFDVATNDRLTNFAETFMPSMIDAIVGAWKAQPPKRGWCCSFLG